MSLNGLQFFGLSGSSSLSFNERSNVDETATVATFGKEYIAVNKSIQSMVFADTYIFTGVMHCAALTFDDVTRFSKLTAKDFDAEAFAF